MNECVGLLLLFGGGQARPFISFLPGIISYLFFLQPLFTRAQESSAAKRSKRDIGNLWARVLQEARSGAEDPSGFPSL